MTVTTSLETMHQQQQAITLLHKIQILWSRADSTLGVWCHIADLIQTCSYLHTCNTSVVTVLIQRTHSEGFVVYTELIPACSEQSGTDLQQLQYRYTTANTTRTVSQQNTFCCVLYADWSENCCHVTSVLQIQLQDL